jgi:peptide/nickel transport system substrate-binding protein
VAQSPINPKGSSGAKSNRAHPGIRLEGPEKFNHSRTRSLKRLRLLPRVLTSLEKLVIVLALMAFFGGAVWWGMRNYLSSTIAVAEQGGTLDLGLVGQPRYINPLLSPTSDVDQDLSTLVFSSLFKLDKDFKLNGDLAESIAVSEDQKIYTIVLRQNLKWHDGQTLDADDVVFTVKSIQDAGWNSPLSLGFRGISVAKVDDRTITFTLQEPYAPFSSTLTFGVLPEHLWASISGSAATLAELNTKPIGSGPFKFDELTKDKTGQIKNFHLVSNPDYHLGAAHLSDIQVRFYESSADLVQAYQDGDIDMVGGVPFADKGSLESKNTSVLTLGLPRYDALFINANNNSYLRPEKTRRALAHAINKPDLISQVLKGNGVEVDSPLTPGSLGYTDALTRYGYNTEGAKQLLTEEGWELRADNRWYKGNDKLIVEIVTADTPENRELAEVVKNFWNAIGIEVVVVNAPVAELQQTHIRERKYQTLLFGEVIGADPDLYPFWHSTQIADPGLNLTSFSNDELDELLEEARKTNDPAQRAAKQSQISKILAEDLHAIFLYSPNYLIAVRANIKGVDLKNINLPSDRFNQINQWYIKTKRVAKD